MSSDSSYHRSALEADLRAWAKNEMTDWDSLVAGQDDVQPASEGDLWDCMPVLDSKAVARTSPIFERHLGMPLSPKLIRAGGYPGIEEMIDHLVPRMEKAVLAKK